MKKFTVDINVGDEIQVGRFRNVITKITGIEVDDRGQPIVITNKGKKNLFSCRIAKLDPGSMTPKEILAKKRSLKDIKE